jgi:uncharacterized protein (TIGR02680 family)
MAESGTGTRFKPTRAGIINLWDYVNEVFLFADGRLVLRGHNGAGKTKALEVLFPFVLDGRTDPRRLDPFSGENRTMKENLLYRGTEAGYGYAWMEFSRHSRANAPPERVTIGIGMQARKHKDGVTPWFFVADGAVGETFDLVVDGRPLSHAGLVEILGADHVMEKARDYRERIDARLFELGTERYDQMLNLVLTLRKPQLSKDLDPNSLSDVLSRGLRPLDDELLAQVAKSFEDLELAQRELERLVAADDTLQVFLSLYRGHIKAVARHRVDEARTAARLIDRCRNDLAAAQTALGTASEHETGVTDALSGTRADLVGVRAQKEALLESPAYQAVTQLEKLEAHLGTAEDAVRKGDSALALLRDNLGDLRDKAAIAETELAEARRERATICATVALKAQECGVEWRSADGDGASDEVRTVLTARVGTRRADVAAVRAHLDQVAEADRKAADADEVLQEVRGKLAAAEARLDACEQATAVARDALAADVQRWAQVRPEATLESGDLEAVLAAIASLGEAGAPTLREVLADRMAARLDRGARDQAELERQRADLDTRDAELIARRKAILGETEDAPATLASRPASRKERMGAPFWRLVRFRDDIEPSAQAGIEAALEAAGILDAWVMPSGEDITGVQDAFLVSRRDSEQPGSLADILLPEEQLDVTPERIAALLRSIAFPVDVENTEAFIGTDGTYRIGPLTGSYGVESARYIGATARAAHRRRRAEAIERERAELAVIRTTVAADLDRVTERLAAYRAAATDLPTIEAVLEALRASDTARGAVTTARENEKAASETLNRWKREGNDRRVGLRREAAARSLPSDAVGIAVIATSLDEVEHHGRALVTEIRRVAERERAATAWRGEHGKRSLELGTREDDHRNDVTTRNRLAVELSTLRANVGADAEALRSELADVTARAKQLEQEENAQQREVQTAIEARTRAEAVVASAESALAAAGAGHLAAMSAVRPLAATDLANLLELDPDAALAALQQSDPTSPEWAAMLAGLDAKTRGSSGSDDRRKTARSQVSSSLAQLGTQLGAHYRAEWTYDDEIIYVTIADDEGANSVASFAHKLSVRRREQEALLTVREREVFEDALLSAMCRQLNTRTTAARDLVRQMDRAMRDRKMSSGKTVGVSWELHDDLSPEQRKVVRLLEFDPANLAPDQLDALRSHFSSEVKTARVAQPSHSYRDILASVLDYRMWRRFALRLIDANGHEDTLTKARHSKLSGGEKAASLHIPLFAAAHAQFSSASPSCPRLVALDEAFAGIDIQGKPELMSLSVEFDLDLFMTGFDLWVTFPGVPMAAHYDLVHVPNENTVSALLLLWDGAEVIEGERAEAVIRSAAGQ